MSLELKEVLKNIFALIYHELSDALPDTCMARQSQRHLSYEAHGKKPPEQMVWTPIEIYSFIKFGNNYLLFLFGI